MRIFADRQRFAHRIAIRLFVALVFFCLYHPAKAQIPSATKSRNTATASFSSPSNGPTTHELTRPDVEEFFDLLINDQLARENIAGAVVGIVKDGQVIFAKGYGYADVARGIPVTADASLFRIGSISKLIT